MKIINTEVSQASKLAKQIAKTIKGGEVFALIGTLGSGKTTFTKHLGKALGIKSTITSPTFTVMQEFLTETRVTAKKLPLYLYHLDLYRTKNFNEIKTLGVHQIWQNPQTITVIEWADKIYSYLPTETIVIKFKDNHEYPRSS